MSRKLGSAGFRPAGVEADVVDEPAVRRAEAVRRQPETDPHGRAGKGGEVDPRGAVAVAVTAETTERVGELVDAVTGHRAVVPAEVEQRCGRAPGTTVAGVLDPPTVQVEHGITVPGGQV